MQLCFIIILHRSNYCPALTTVYNIASTVHTTNYTTNKHKPINTHKCTNKRTTHREHILYFLRWASAGSVPGKVMVIAEDDAPTSYVRTASGHILVITNNWNTDPLATETSGLTTTTYASIIWSLSNYLQAYSPKWISKTNHTYFWQIMLIAP